ncbi:MAG: hypothetical protein R3E08_01860 [Thiotrichaceae bacterium]
MNTLIWKLCVIWGMLISYPLFAEFGDNDWASSTEVQFQEAQQAIEQGDTRDRRN